MTIDLAATTSRLIAESAYKSAFRSDIQHDLWRQLAILAETQLRAEGIWWSERRMAASGRTGWAGAAVETIHFPVRSTATPDTPSACDSSNVTAVLFATSQILIAWSRLPLTTRLPSGMKATL